MTITFNEVTRRYGPVLGLNNLSLKIGLGITGLIGPNGAGKTTFLNLAVGLHRPSSGTVRFLGKDLFDHPERRAWVGYCPDGERAWDWMTGRRFVVTLGTWSGLSQKEAEERAGALLTELEMTEAADKPLAEYSRGMRQKVKVAQALIHRPELLVLDEPLNGVDPLSRHQILKMLRERSGKGAILISSHVLHELEGVVDQVVLLHRGRLLASGTIESIRDLLDEHPRSLRFRCDRCRELAGRLLALDGTVSAQLEDDQLVVRTRDPGLLYARLPEMIMKGGFKVNEMVPTDADLESVFRYLVKGGGG